MILEVIQTDLSHGLEAAREQAIARVRRAGLPSRDEGRIDDFFDRRQASS